MSYMSELHIEAINKKEEELLQKALEDKRLYKIEERLELLEEEVKAGRSQPFKP